MASTRPNSSVRSPDSEAIRIATRHRRLPTDVEIEQIRLAGMVKLSQIREDLAARNLRAEKSQTLSKHRALQKAAERFLNGGKLESPRELDLARWPYVSQEEKIISNVPLSLKALILGADMVCRWCLRARATTIDHVRPLNRGGSNSVLNLVGACSPCNSAKSDFLPSELGWLLHLPLRAFAIQQWLP